MKLVEMQPAWHLFICRFNVLNTVPLKLAWAVPLDLGSAGGASAMPAVCICCKCALPRTRALNLAGPRQKQMVAAVMADNFNRQRADAWTRPGGKRGRCLCTLTCISASVWSGPWALVSLQGSSAQHAAPIPAGWAGRGARLRRSLPHLPT